MRRISAIIAALALITGSIVFFASPALSATYTVCAGGGCDYTTITAAVSAAAAGDTITIAAGTYQENSILVNKPLTIIGAGIDATIVDGQNLTTYASPGVFTVVVPATDPGTISISGLTIINAGKTGPTNDAFGISVASPGATTAITSITLDHIKIVGTASQDYGIWVYSPVPNRALPPNQVPTLTVSNSIISGTYQSGIGVDAWNADVLIEGNTLSESVPNLTLNQFPAILIMNEYTSSRITAANVVRNNTSTGRLVALRNNVSTVYGGYDSFTATGNTITGLSVYDYGIYVATNAASNAAFSRIRNATITGNTITGDGMASGTRGVLIAGLVENSIVNENDITGVGIGVAVILNNGLGAVKVQANRNRLFANEIGVENRLTAAAVDANDNWWGCVGGPASPSGYCSPVTNTGAGTVVTNRWISAVASAASPTLMSGTTTTVTGQFGALNNGTTIALPSIFDGLVTTFTVDNGSVSPTSGTLNPTLAGTTTYTATAVGPDEVRVAIDRADFSGVPAGGTSLHYGIPVVLGEPIPVAINVTPFAGVAPVITSGTPPAPVRGTAYSFQVTATGTPAPTFAITGGALPPGLVLSSSGLISGTPRTNGTFTFNVTATNGTSPNASATYTLTSRASALAITGTTTAAPMAFGGLLALILGVGILLSSRAPRLRKSSV